MLHSEMPKTWTSLSRAVPGLARLTLAACVSVLAVAPALAADLPPRPAAMAPPAPKTPLMTELRLGIFAHDPGSPESGGVDINGEILLPKWFGADSAWSVLYPRLHVGGSANTSGNTSAAYAGLTWSLDFLPNFFIEGTLGGAVHNGDTGVGARHGESSLGCSPLFRESASLGYRFTPQISVMATVEHYSNAGLCSQNRGLTNAGVRLGYSF